VIPSIQSIESSTADQGPSRAVSCKITLLLGGVSNHVLLEVVGLNLTLAALPSCRSSLFSSPLRLWISLSINHPSRAAFFATFPSFVFSHPLGKGALDGGFTAG
jgi:hypothetical protein